MHVLHVNFSDRGGGAARVALEIVATCSRIGVDVELLCARPTHRSSRLLGVGLRERAGILLKSMHGASRCRNQWFGDTRGICDGTYVRAIMRTKPDMIHLHNIHDGWFSLSLLPRLASATPLVWTLHDEWAYTGHCTATLGCNRWLQGCYECPSLDTFVPLRRDTAARNRVKRKEIYQQIPVERLTLVTPSLWLADRVRQSGVWRGRIEVIPNGVNTEVFYPGNRDEARKKIDLNRESKVILFLADRGIGNPFKNGRLVLSALSHLPNSCSVTAVVLGGTTRDELPHMRNVSFVAPGYVHDSELLRQYYCAADLVVYPTRADTFGLVVAEAMACGTPVLATRVGGVAEQVEQGINGFLVEPDIPVSQLSQIISQLLDNVDRLHDMRDAAANSVRKKYSSQLMSARYLELYRQMVNPRRD